MKRSQGSDATRRHKVSWLLGFARASASDYLVSPRSIYLNMRVNFGRSPMVMSKRGRGTDTHTKGTRHVICPESDKS